MTTGWSSAPPPQVIKPLRSSVHNRPYQMSILYDLLAFFTYAGAAGAVPAAAARGNQLEQGGAHVPPAGDGDPARAGGAGRHAGPRDCADSAHRRQRALPGLRDLERRATAVVVLTRGGQTTVREGGDPGKRGGLQASRPRARWAAWTEDQPRPAAYARCYC
eukprot:687042-Prorocentrum_minimum.AAC.3